MNTNSNQPQKAAYVEDHTSGLTRVTAVLAIIVALIAFVIPIMGPALGIPISLALAAVAMWGGDFKSMGLVSTILGAVNYGISPTTYMVLSGGRDSQDIKALFFFGFVLLAVCLVLLVRKFASSNA